jgi:hypothetical protein
MRDAVRTRTRGVTLATIALAAATVSARHVSKVNEKPSLAKSFEADPEDWSDANPSESPEPDCDVIDCCMGPGCAQYYERRRLHCANGQE